MPSRGVADRELGVHRRGGAVGAERSRQIEAVESRRDALRIEGVEGGDVSQDMLEVAGHRLDLVRREGEPSQ